MISAEKTASMAGDARWVHEGIDGRRTFESIDNAAAFIMEMLEPKLRGTAWIAVDGEPNLTIDDVEVIYHRSPWSPRVRAGTPKPAC